MQNTHLWEPSKFVIRAGRCVASSDTRQVAASSRMMADMIARAYEHAIKGHAQGLLLDLGCGHVPLYEVYRPHVTDNICVDWVNTSHKNPYLDHQFDLNCAIPLESSQFDTILATDLLEHIREPDLLWSEMSRLLKPGGKLILGVPFLYWIHEEPYDYNRYTEYRLRDFCMTHGFDVVTLDSYGGAKEVLRDILAKQASSARRCTGAGFRLVSLMLRAIFRLQRPHGCGERETFPLGYCLVAQKELSAD